MEPLLRDALTRQGEFLEANLKDLENDYFLKDIVGLFKKNNLPVEGLNTSITTNELISLVDAYVPLPGLEHYDLIQGAWFREHEYLMKQNLSQIESDNFDHGRVVIDWVTTRGLQVGHHKEYAERYILGRSLRKMDKTDLLWIGNFLKRVAKEIDMSDYYSTI